MCIRLIVAKLLFVLDMCCIVLLRGHSAAWTFMSPIKMVPNASLQNFETSASMLSIEAISPCVSGLYHAPKIIGPRFE